MMEGGEMALLAAPTFSDARMFCDANYQGTESTTFLFRNCVLSLFPRKENFSVDDFVLKINFLKGYTNMMGWESQPLQPLVP